MCTLRTRMAKECHRLLMLAGLQSLRRVGKPVVRLGVRPVVRQEEKLEGKPAVRLAVRPAVRQGKPGEKCSLVN